MNSPQQNPISNQEEAIEALSLLDETEQAKVLDYIQTLVELHYTEQQES